MNQLIKKLFILIVVTLIIGSCFGVYSVRAQNDKLNLEVIEQCDIKYAGDSCVAELKLFNNTGKVLDGKASLHINYQGICSNNELVDFDGEGIEAQFSINSGEWLNFTGWKNGTTTVSGFNIAKGETQSSLKIKTHPALCPGGYTFIFSLKGTFEEEEYITPPVVAGGVAYIPPKPTTIITGDINGDGKVDKYDFALMMANWGKIGANTSDLNNDGKVNKYDFAILMANWTIA